MQLPLLLFALSLHAQEKPIHAADRFVFPRAAPELQGMDQAKLEATQRYAMQGGGSGCVIHGGKLVMAWGDQRKRYDLYSSTKSIGVTAIGLAIMDGKVRLDDKAQTYLPQVGVPPDSNRDSGWLGESTLFHLATQTGGFEKTRGWCRQLYRPGTTWAYSDGGPNWLADCLTVAYGRDLLEVMGERVFTPLGITVGETRQGGDHDLYWGFNNLDRPRQLNGINRRPFGAGIHANVAAMAKIGSLYLHRGKWEGTQILPEDFVRLASEPAHGLASLPVKDDLGWTGGASHHYGLLWWNNADGTIPEVPRDAFWTCRMKDGFLVVIPSLDLVVARAGEYLRPARSHEGIDIDLTDARGKGIHALVAIEDATVRWIAQGNSPEACLLLESASYPGLYYIYQHLNRDKLFVQPGQKVRRGEKLAYIWGDGRWGHLHFSVVGSGGQPDYGQRYRSLLNCFPHLVELWHGSLTLEIPVRTSGNSRFANQYWEDGNRQHLSAWSDVLGFGWQLGDWCAAGKVGTSLTDEGGKPFQGARLSKIIHQQTGHPARNPQDWFDFEVAVENGTCRVRAEVGDQYAATWQWVEFEGVDAGTFELPPGQLRRTDERPVTVNDGRLTARIQLRDNRTPAGLRNLTFERIP
jgi:CubicO group peptidase (beta-lactamase class C family)